MKSKADIPDLPSSEWYFVACPTDQTLLCAYYEYARSSPTMIKAIENVHPDVYTAVTELPRPKDVAFQTRRFPATPWLEILKCDRRRITSWIGKNLPPRDLVYQKRPEFFESKFLLETDFEEFGPCITFSEKTSTALIQVHWALSNAELREAFQRFLTTYRPAGTGPRKGRIRSEFDYLNSLGAKRLMDHCSRAGTKHVSKLAFEMMKRQVDASEGAMRPLYATPSALATAAGKAKEYLLALYQVRVDRRIAENQRMKEEEMDAVGSEKPWFPGIYLEDPADFG